MPKVPEYKFPTRATKQPDKRMPVSHVEATAKAWNVQVEDMYRIWDWLENKVPEYRRWSALLTILRKQYTLPKKYKKIKVKQTKLL